MPSYSTYKQCKCPVCNKRTNTHLIGRKDICDICGSETKFISWSIRFRAYENNKPVHKQLSGFATKKDAENEYLKYMNLYKSAKPTSKQPIYKMSFESAYMEFLKVKASEVKQSTYYDIIKCFSNNMVPYFKDKLVIDIDTQNIRDWQDFLTSKNYAYKTKEKNRSYLFNLFNYLYQEYNLPNVVQRVKGFSKKMENSSHKEMLIIEPDEYRLFDNAIPQNELLDRAMFNVLYACQTRKGEMCALKWNDWLQDKTKLNITKTFTRVSLEVDNKKYPVPKAEIFEEYNVGSRSKYIIHTPKSTNSKRKIELGEQTIERLQSLYDFKASQKDFNVDGFIFEDNGKFMNYSTLSNRFEKYKRKSGINPALRIHDLRHSGVSLLINTYNNKDDSANGLQLAFIIAERIGDSVEQIMHTYGHLFKNSQSKLVKHINI